MAAKYLLPARAAAVVSKWPEADVHPKNLRALADALMADARADSAMSADEAAAVADKGRGSRAFAARAFAVMRAHLTGRDAAP